MRILAIDTATEVCGVAAAVEDDVLAELRLLRERTHTNVLMEAVHAILGMVRWDLDMVDAFAVARGPGSFTGLRIGISTVKGMALAAQKPMVGISTLQALALQAPDGFTWVCPMIDARRHQVYWSLYKRRGEGLTLFVPEQAGAPLDVAAHLDGPCLFVGNGARLYAPELKARLPDWAMAAGNGLSTISPAAVARLAWQRLAQGDHEDVRTFAPVYLRPSDARQPKPILPNVT